MKTKLAVLAVVVMLFIGSPYVFRSAHAQPGPPIQSRVPCSALPAATGDVARSAGSCAETVTGINGASVVGTQGNLASFGLSNTVLDSGVSASTACGGVGACVSGSLTQTQILGLSNSSVVTLVLAQGAGTLIVPDQTVVELVFNNAAYTAGSSFGVYWTSGAAGLLAQTTAFTSSFLDTAANKTALAPPNSTATGFASTGATVNAPLVISLSAATQFACASTCGTLSYWVKYHVVTGLF